MSTEENKTIGRSFYEAINQGNLAAFDDLLVPDFVEHEAIPLETPPGRESVKQFFAMIRSGLPDYQATVEDELAEGDKVTYRVTFRGSHQGQLMGIPPTGKQVTMTAIDIFRIAGGQLAEHWGVADRLGPMQQLGVIPTPGQGQ